MNVSGAKGPTLTGAPTWVLAFFVGVLAVGTVVAIVVSVRQSIIERRRRGAPRPPAGSEVVNTAPSSEAMTSRSISDPPPFSAEEAAGTAADRKCASEVEFARRDDSSLRRSG